MSNNTNLTEPISNSIDSAPASQNSPVVDWLIRWAKGAMVGIVRDRSGIFGWRTSGSFWHLRTHDSLPGKHPRQVLEKCPLLPACGYRRRDWRGGLLRGCGLCLQLLPGPVQPGSSSASSPAPFLLWSRYLEKKAENPGIGCFWQEWLSLPFSTCAGMETIQKRHHWHPISGAGC